jgi:hypothetical protein
MANCLIVQEVPQELKDKIDKEIYDELSKVGLNELLENINKNPALQRQIVSTLNDLEETCETKTRGGKRNRLRKKMKGGMFLIPSTLQRIFSPYIEQILDNTYRNPNVLRNLKENIEEYITNLKRGSVNKIGDVSALAIASIILSLIIYLSACYTAYIYTPPILDRIPMWAQDIIQKIIYDEQRCLSTIPNFFSTQCSDAETRLYYGLRYLLFKIYLLLNFTSISAIVATSSAMASPDGKINIFNIANLLINLGNTTGLPNNLKIIVGRMIGLATPEERQEMRNMAQQIIEEVAENNPGIQIDREAIEAAIVQAPAVPPVVPPAVPPAPAPALAPLDEDGVPLFGGYKKPKNYKQIKKTKRKKYTNKTKRRKTHRR